MLEHVKHDGFKNNIYEYSLFPEYFNKSLMITAGGFFLLLMIMLSGGVWGMFQKQGQLQFWVLTSASVKTVVSLSLAKI